MPLHIRKYCVAGFLALLGVACTSSHDEAEIAAIENWTDSVTLEVPPGFPEPIFPEDNALIKGRIALGHHLFFDTRLSKDNSISCASCHKAANAMADNVRFSLGVGDSLGDRNAPALMNLAWQTSFMRDGGIPTLELQVLDPLSDPMEMHFNIVDAASRVADDSLYAHLAEVCYGRKVDAYVITRSLAAYQRQLVSAETPYDAYINEGKPLEPDAMEGLKLFEQHCSACHSGPLFTDYSLKNNGLYQHYADSGRARITFRTEDVGFYRVPSLRNVAFSPPYMHDGSLNTLEEVVEHYNKGGAGHVLQDTMVRPLQLSELQKGQLVAFLHALSDSAFLRRPDLEAPVKIP